MFIDLEAEVISALRDAGISVPIHTQIPDPRPPVWLQVVRIGGPVETIASEAAQIELYGHADNEGDAVSALNDARLVLFNLDGRSETIFNGHEYGGVINLPDSTTTQARYSCNWTVRARF